jgi:hypothetical protein
MEGKTLDETDCVIRHSQPSRAVLIATYTPVRAGWLNRIETLAPGRW